MKKLLSVLLALAMLLTCCAAFAETAEEEITFSDADIGVKVEAPAGKIEFAEPQAYAVSTSDVVTVSGNMNTVRADGLTFMLNAPSGYIVFTQDYYASINAYMYVSDPDALIKAMIDNNIHLIAYDTFAGVEIDIKALGSDTVSQKVGNLANLSDSNIVNLTVAFGNANGLQAVDAYRIGSHVWMRFAGGYFVTIVGGQYVLATWYMPDAQELSDADMNDMGQVLYNLSIFG